MQKIPIMLAKTGMILAHDIFREGSPGGIPICGKGTELTDSLILRFEHMNILTILVEGHPVWVEGERSLNDLLQDLEGRFSKTLQEPLNSVLFNIYRNYLSKSMEGDIDRQAE